MSSERRRGEQRLMIRSDGGDVMAVSCSLAALGDRYDDGDGGGAGGTMLPGCPL